LKEIVSTSFSGRLKCISLSKGKKEFSLDSRYFKAKLKVFFPPLEGGKEGEE